MPRKADQSNTIPAAGSQPGPTEAKPRVRTVRTTHSRQGIKTPDGIEAQVWVLKEEGQPWRKIAEDLGISVQTVGRILAKDPARLEALVSAKREERARLWERVENQSLKSLDTMLRNAHTSLFNRDGTLKKKLSRVEERLLDMGSKWSSNFRHVAESATRMNQLLTGGATERIGSDGTTNPTEQLTEDQAIEFAVKEGLIEKLPPALRIAAYARMQGTDAGKRPDQPA